MKGEYSNFYYVPNAYVNLIINIKAVVFLATGFKVCSRTCIPMMKF